MRSLLAALFFTLGSLLFSVSAFAWDSATHRLITRLAIAALPESPLRAALLHNQPLVERHSVEPDSILKDRYGRREEIRHYIDLEVYNPNTSDALSQLDPNLTAMRRRVGDAKLEESGTLPWTIEDMAWLFGKSWRDGSCSEMLRDGGYLAHYVGDASQPLHSTIYYDGYRRDRGIHARVESAVDSLVPTIEVSAAREVKVQEITAVWPVEIDEIRAANSLVKELIEADRKARKVSRKNPKYAAALFSEAGPMLTGQIAQAASVLASVWLYEWKQAGGPSRCTGTAR